MLSELEQACKTYSTESSSGLIEFDSNWQRIFVTALTFHLDRAIQSKETSLLYASMVYYKIAFESLKKIYRLQSET